MNLPTLSGARSWFDIPATANNSLELVPAPGELKVFEE